MAHQEIPNPADTPSPQPVLNRKGFPTLFEVLQRRTLAPIDLFSFYIYMRDIQNSVDYLDFWLDVSQHMSLCRHYVRQLRRSTMIETPELEKGASKRSSAILEQFPDPGPSEKFDPTADGQRISAFLRSDSGSRHSPQNSQDSNRVATSHGEALPRPSFLAQSTPGTGSSPGQYSSSPGQDSSADHPPTVTREDIRASAERILYQYLIPNAEREIIIPASMLDAIHRAIEEEGRDDPEVFDEAKDYVFQAMQRDAFRDFLYRKGLGNLVPASLMTRMIAGLFFMFAAWWIAFTFIFLDEDRSTRCWVILPFILGIYLLCSHQFMLDPILALANQSEYTYFNFHEVKEPYVRMVQHRRALWILLLVILLTGALVVLFVFVPGKRL